MSDCQIELCRNDCTSDEEAIKKGFGTVCVGSTAGVTNPNEPAEVCSVGGKCTLARTHVRTHVGTRTRTRTRTR